MSRGCGGEVMGDRVSVATFEGTVRINTRPLCDALARLDELATAGGLTEAERAQVIGRACVGSVVSWVFDAEGLLVAHPAAWLAELIQAAGAR